jgi:hypothetical protein
MQISSCVLNPAIVALALVAAVRSATAANIDPEMFKTPLYEAQGDAFVRHNGDRFNNRPLYCNQITGIFLAGDRPAYAYNAEKAAVELAKRAHDEASVKKHKVRVDKIYNAFISKLWVKDKDYVGAYVEQRGHERLHPDCWLYAIFCPIDAGLLSTDQAAQSLYYTEWGLQRDDMPYGGQRVRTSNWVPSKWSLREMWPGDC